MFDVFNSIIQLILAIAAFIISIVEIRKDNKEKEQIKHTEKIETELVKTIQYIKIDELIDEIKELQFSLDVEEKLEDILSRDDSIREQIVGLYKQLLKDESTFSLSYGFERYINQFRQVCIKGQYIKENLSKGKNSYINGLKGNINLCAENMDDESQKNVKRLLYEFKRNKKELDYNNSQQHAALYNNVPTAMTKVAADIVWGLYINYLEIEKSLGILVDILVGTQEIIEEIKIKYCE